MTEDAAADPATATEQAFPLAVAGDAEMTAAEESADSDDGQ